jgi:hypothetical protein
MTPPADCKEDAKKHEIHNNKNLADYKDRRRDAVRVVHGCPFDSIDTISFVTTIKRE